MAYFYYPGCQYTARSPDNSEKIKHYLHNRFHMVIPGCCRTHSQSLTREDTAVCICPTCLINIQQNAPQANAVSVWEVLADDNQFPWPDFQNEPITVQDCIDTRQNRRMQDAVRTVLSHMQVHSIETNQSFEKADFCRPRTEAQREAVAKHCMNMTTDTVVGYCTGCVKALVSGGKKGVHLMDLIMNSMK